MKIRTIVAMLATGVVLAGCGTQSLGNGPAARLFGGMFGADQAANPEAGVPSKARMKTRFGVLQEEVICDTCWVTGGGAGNETACGDAKFGLNAHDTDGTTGDDGKGRLEFQFEKGFHINGPVSWVKCGPITEGEKGDTWGSCEFGGDVQVEKGLPGSGYTFRVLVEDSGEPNVLDKLTIWIYDENGTPVQFDGQDFYTCFTEDGNIQLHPTRFEQVN